MSLLTDIHHYRIFEIVGPGPVHDAYEAWQGANKAGQKAIREIWTDIGRADPGLVEGAKYRVHANSSGLHRLYGHWGLPMPEGLRRFADWGVGINKRLGKNNPARVAWEARFKAGVILDARDFFNDFLNAPTELIWHHAYVFGGLVGNIAERSFVLPTHKPSPALSACLAACSRGECIEMSPGDFAKFVVDSRSASGSAPGALDD